MRITLTQSKKQKRQQRAGLNMIVFDVSEKPLEESIAETRRGVEAVKSIRPEILVEGGLGYVGLCSEIHDKRPDNIRLTEPEDARQFFAETRADLLSPSVEQARDAEKYDLGNEAQAVAYLANRSRQDDSGSARSQIV